MRQRFGPRAAVAAIVLFTIAAPAAAQVTLRYKWNKGDVLDYRVTLHTTSEVSGVPGRDDAKTEQMITQQITLSVDGVTPSGVATVHETVTAIRSELTSPNGLSVVDTATPSQTSQDPIAQSMAKMLAAVIGQPILIVFSPDGSVRSIEGGSRLLERVVAAAGADRDAAMASQALTAIYSDEALRSMLEQSFPRLPPQPLKPGDTWTGQLALGNQAVGRIAADLTFTLKTVDGAANAQRATIGAAMKLTQALKPPAGGATRVSLALGDSHGDGQLVFDVSRGRIISNSMRTEMPSTVSMIGPEGTPVTFKNRVRTTATMELVTK
jgi:Family of unknown function (DUF6263)